jgi:hypothetical protein
MRHLTEEEIVNRYFGEDAGAADAHLEECGECAAALAALDSELAAMRTMDVPERDENYGEQMWARVEGALPPKRMKHASSGAIGLWRAGLWRRVAYVAAFAVLVAGSFYGGTVYEHWQHHRLVVARAKLQPPATAPQPKVVVVVLGDHLDRSERLLVELKHADSDGAELDPLRDEARSLLAANRVFRDDAEREGDPALTKALNHLDKLLTEMANQPGGMNSAAVARIRDEMNAEGLLFEVRVLRSKNPHRTQAVRVIAKGGAA